MERWLLALWNLKFQVRKKDMTQYSIGIDLGTSNSALAYCKDDENSVHILDIPQVQRLGELFTSHTLSSAMYLAPDKEVNEAEVRLPWETQGNTQKIVGNWALSRGTLSPDRLVLSAKSWLINQFTDPREEILPWSSDLSQKISPLHALSSYLLHLKSAFVHQFPDAAVSNVVITIPASFDEAARQLVVEAAQLAGLEKLSLLEEPQAAFYSFITSHAKTWQKQVQAGDLVLVCDVGGGTSDFSLIAIHDQDDSLALERIAVGDHLLLGGDNMDMAIAYMLKAEFAKNGTNLDNWQFLSLVNEARRAKELLLADEKLKEVPISITKRGSKLMASTLTHVLTRSQVESLVLDGFFPVVGVDETLEKRTLGIQEWGLPYESDPAITKHLSAFLKRAYQTLKASPHLSKLTALPADRDYLLPNRILFNGGVFEAQVLKDRILNILKTWGAQNLELLSNPQLALAVAKGAAYFAHIKKSGKGVRIKAGTVRSYYIGLEAPRLAVPGWKASLKALCVLPQGTEEGTHLPPTKNQFALLTGESVQFRFFHSKQRGADSVGTFVEDAESVLEESPALSVTLPNAGAKKELVPVTLEAAVSDVGTLQLFMKHVKSDQKWQLEFDLRKSENG